MKKLLKDAVNGVVYGLALSFLIINLNLPQKVMNFFDDIKTIKQAEMMLEILDNEPVGHINPDKVKWNEDFC